MGLEIDILWLTVLLFGCLGALLLLGLPMAFCTGSLAVIFLYVFGSPAVLNICSTSSRRSSRTDNSCLTGTTRSSREASSPTRERYATKE